MTTVTPELIRELMPVRDESLPPVQCQPWCSTRDGHAGDHMPEDQTCCSDEGAEIPLTAMRPQYCKATETHSLRRVTTYLFRNGHSNRTLVELFVNGNGSTKLTVNEAELLGRSLLELVELERKAQR